MSKRITCILCGSGEYLRLGSQVCGDSVECRVRAAEGRGYRAGLMKAEGIASTHGRRFSPGTRLRLACSAIRDAIRAASEGEFGTRVHEDGWRPPPRWKCFREPNALGKWRALHERWVTAEVVEREFERDGADLVTWRVLIDGEEDERALHEFHAWFPLVQEAAVTLRAQHKPE